MQDRETTDFRKVDVIKPTPYDYAQEHMRSVHTASMMPHIP